MDQPPGKVIANPHGLYPNFTLLKDEKLMSQTWLHFPPSSKQVTSNLGKMILKEEMEKSLPIRRKTRSLPDRTPFHSCECRGVSGFRASLAGGEGGVEACACVATEPLYLKESAGCEVHM